MGDACYSSEHTNMAKGERQYSMAANWWETLTELVTTLEERRIDYTILNRAALYAQGALEEVPRTIDISIQWDLFAHAHELLPSGSITHEGNTARFSFRKQPFRVTLSCQYNTVVATDPDRLRIEHAGRHFWVKAPDYYVRTLSPEDELVRVIKAYWQRLQEQNNRLNMQAWNQDTYDAWLARFGSPQEAAQRILKDPRGRLGSLVHHLPEVQGKKIINLLGSHGAKAIALAQLGARATVVDISEGNARYARDVAQAAGVDLRYIVSDVLSLPESELDASYDLVLLELGVLHYFVDLEPLFSIIKRLLRPGGLLLLQDFHPISTKLIISKGAKHKVKGNYFDKALITKPVALSKHLPTGEQENAPIVYQRQWTLGEVVTAVATSDLIISSLDEEPNPKLDDIGIPKLFTLTARNATP
ncbi:Methyltransferase type 11 [Ktedonobacter racemifer DSM 44963]|uniref:Methyltransferase type 11 n=2 Tax=Ktedonobacter racemifer TaxID=363277 RepID=D6U4W2_KTERA|nr:Methyltransferase type 11 [Ktedonobacter racemifer DSM 44963]